jgi:hypothetical protein
MPDRTYPTLRETREKFYKVLPGAGAGSGAWLTLDERRQLLQGLEIIFDGCYAHLPLKRARYGFDPVQRLRILRTQAADLSDADFYYEFIDIIARLRDSHTQYSRLVEGSYTYAALPFLVEQYTRGRATRYIATNVHPDLTAAHPEFVSGVHITHWDGLPIDTALKRYGEREYGGRADSALAFALASLTIRPLERMDLPDADVAQVGFRVTTAAGEPAGAVKTAVLDWRLLPAPELGPGFPAERAAHRRATRALHPLAAALKRAQAELFAPRGPRGAGRGAARAAGAGKLSDEIRVGGRLAEKLRAATLQAEGGPYGYLRIFDFDVDERSFVREVMRLLALLPDRGLVVDIRGNPGGNILAAELVLQLLTPRPIEPVRFSVLATPFTRALAGLRALEPELEPWRESLEAAVRNGEAYGQALPLTPPGDCNAIGQVYGGPVVLVADAMTYSSGDIFSAGFVDNRIGPFICVGRATGAGGANVWTYEDFRVALESTPLALPELPDGGTLTFSFRRITRSGAAAGTPVEDVGVPAGDTYAMTFDDLVHGNRDLLATCARRLRALPFSRMRAELEAGTLAVYAEGLDGVDIQVDGRSGAYLAAGPRAPARFKLPRGARKVEVRGLRQGEVVQRRRLDVR